MSEILHTLNPTDTAWLSETFARNRARFGGWLMEEGSGDGDGEGEGGKTLSQADVDAAVEKIAAKIRSEERRKASEKYADYDDLKTKVAGAKTVEDRLAEIERQAKESEDRALRAEVANAKGLTASQARRLIGSTREELEADADEFLKDVAERESERKKRGNRVPTEGQPNRKSTDDPMREFARGLFGKDD